MFGFGRDLRRLFAQARDGRDRTWIELIGVDLLEAEARGQAIDGERAGRSSAATLKAAALWREHARRTGLRASLTRALAAAAEGDRASDAPNRHAEAALETALCLMLQYELRGGPERLKQAEWILDGHAAPRDASLNARLTAAGARLAGLQARQGGETAAMLAAVDRLTAALNGLERRPDLAVETADAQMDRAALALEIGFARQDAGLLDRAGRDLRALIETASPEYRPVTHARALTLCAAGLSALAVLADDAEARAQAHAMFDAAADAFTPDHSPLDWAAIELARTARDPAADVRRLIRVEAVTGGEGLILGALARERRIALEIQAMTKAADAAGLSRMETRLRLRLGLKDRPLDWTVDQIGLARIRLARTALTGRDGARHVGLILTEAAETAREMGAGLIADRAREVMTSLEQMSARGAA